MRDKTTNNQSEFVRWIVSTASVPRHKRRAEVQLDDVLVRASLVDISRGSGGFSYRISARFEKAILADGRYDSVRYIDSDFRHCEHGEFDESGDVRDYLDELKDEVVKAHNGLVPRVEGDRLIVPSFFKENRYFGR